MIKGIDNNIDKESINMALTWLVLFSIMLGQCITLLLENLESHGSVMLSESDPFMDYVIPLFFTFFLVLISARERGQLLRLAFLFGAAGFCLSSAVISFVGVQELYVVRLLALVIAIGLLCSHLARVFIHSRQQL